MAFKYFLLTSLFVLGLSACNSDEDTLDISEPISIDFSQSEHEFQPIFSDYPVSTTEQNNEEFYQLETKYDSLPDSVNSKKAWRLQGNNHSDDLLMAIKGQVKGLKSNHLYRVEIAVDITSDIPANCFGIGGAPGESVYIKLAASTAEPNNEILDDYYRLTTDIGNQSNSGTEGQTVGNVANGIDCMEDQSYTDKTLATLTTIDVMTNDQGAFWVLAGSDSGFEGLTYYYINKLTLTIRQ